VSPQGRETVSAWEICASLGQTLSVEVAVSATQTSIPGVDVTVKGGNWSKAAKTDAAGIAKIPIDVNVVQASPASGGSAPMFSLGGVDVEISAANWIGGRSRLWLVDCAAAGAFRQQVFKTRERWLERLAGYSELQRIRDELNRSPRLPAGIDTLTEVNVIPYDLGAPRDPRVAEASRIGARLALLDHLTTFIGFETGDRPGSDILGLGEDADQHATLNRIDDLWSQLGRSGEEFQRQFGDRPHDKPD
jgi:hypothetical protein